MKTKRMIWKILLAIITVSVGLTSCLDDPEPVALDPAADVFVQKIMTNGEVQYGVSYWVLGNKPLESVTVETPDNETISLDEDPENNQVFSFFPETQNYTTISPEAGEYTFTVTSTQTNENPVTVTDDVESDELETLVIDSTQFVNSKLQVSWESLENADSYYVRLYNASDQLIFISPQISGSATEYAFGPSDFGWANSESIAETGVTYMVEVVGVLYESGATSSTQAFNIHYLSLDSTEVVWGQ